MREMKFRAWDREEKNFMYFGATDGLKSECDETYIRLNVGRIDQYTGLLDKNGKEIYEGDIVSYNHAYPKWSDENKLEMFIGAVEWFSGHLPDGKNAKFHINNRRDKYEDIIWSNIIVIGNIYESPHENKELLK